MKRALIGVLTFFIGAVGNAVAGNDAVAQWPAVSGNDAGQRFSPLTQIGKDNVDKLQPVWTYRHGDFSTGNAQHGPTAFEATPLVIDGTLYFCTPYNRVIALDPESGKEKWVFDPKVKLDAVYSPVCRGVTYWRDAQAAAGSACRDRIYTGTVDARLIALDAHSGKPCADFGSAGSVNLLDGLGDVETGEYYVSSAPLQINGLVVTGAFVKDGQRLDAPSGAVRAYDARSGELKWVWDPVPPDLPAVTAEQIKQGATLTRGTPNAWSMLSADPEQGLIYVPTGNPSPDHFGGSAPRSSKSYYGSSVVALDANTGAVRWHFQTVHHDLWDYDVAAQPVLFQQQRDGASIPAVIGATKLGFIFLLNRLDGTPLFPVEERPVPKSTVPGETAAPTQPFPTKPAPLHPLSLSRDEIWGLTFWDKGKCQEQFDKLDYAGAFTPPSLKGTLGYPGLGGGINWGSVSVDPVRNRMIVNVQVAPFSIKLVPRTQVQAAGQASDLVGLNPQLGTPYMAVRDVFLSPFKAPCVPPPWGRLVAIDLNTGEKLWERPLGNLHTLAPPVIGNMLEWGTPNSGGSLQTGAGLVFIAATMDKYFRAFDADSGAELWRYELPFAGHSTPMSFRLKAGGKQYVVIAAGGHGAIGTEPGDALMAFALPD